MEDCSCGARRRLFWVWEDANGVLHASGFNPSSGKVRAMVAATARDALLPVTGERPPKHQVHDADDPSQMWDGRCQTSLAMAAS